MGAALAPVLEQQSLATPQMLHVGVLDRRASPAAEKLHLVEPHKKITISCIDYREGGRDGYLLTSAGNIPHDAMLDDLHLVLKGKEALVLRCHTDCAKSKAELPRHEHEGDVAYARRVDNHTLRRMWRDAQVLLRDPEIHNSVKNGMYFCMACFDTRTGMTIYFERESERLVRELV